MRCEQVCVARRQRESDKRDQKKMEAVRQWCGSEKAIRFKRKSDRSETSEEHTAKYKSRNNI